jgi:hypothetical protein
LTRWTSSGPPPPASDHIRAGFPRRTTRKTLRKRLKRERGIRIGKNVWWLVKGKKARIVFKTRGSKVLEIGLADARLTRTNRAAKRTLRTWELPRKR